MKKILSIALSLLMLLTVLPAGAMSAMAETSDGYVYKLTDGKATITKYQGTNRNLTIPETLGGYTVTGIGENAFMYSSITSITIGSNVTSIGKMPFYMCYELKNIAVDSENPAYCSVDGILYNKDKTTIIQYPSSKTGASFIIPDGVTTIDDGAFAYNESLISVTMPDSVTAIKNNAFYYCSGITDINISDGATSIGENAFSGCMDLTSIIIPSSVTTIGESAFNECYLLESLTIGNGVTKIDKWAFSYCRALKNVIIPNSVTSIGRYAFLWCSDLTNVTLSNSITKISESAFRHCENLTSITIPNSVTSIETNALSYCYKLTNVTIPNNVTSIGYKAFYDSKNLTSAVIPSSVTSIDEEAFTGVSADFAIYGDAGSYAQQYAGANNIPFMVCAHTSTIVLNSVSPSCTADGYTGDVCCNECGMVITGGSVIPALGHSYTSQIVAPTCTEQGYTLYTCSACGDTYKADYTAVIDHNYTSQIVAPTCTEQGYTLYTCSACGDTYKADYTAALDHNYANGACTVCGAADPSYVAPTPPAQPVTIKSVKLSTSTYTYNGKVKKPSVKVVDSNGSTVSSSNYTVTYARGRKNVGKYSVKVKFKGKFSGSKTLYFKINPKSTSLSSVKAGKKKLTVKWKKQTTQTTGYQVQYSTSKKFTGAKKTTVSKNKTTSKTISKLKGKKKYYVRVRTYKTVGKTKYYSSWSKAKSVTTKK